MNKEREKKYVVRERERERERENRHISRKKMDFKRGRDEGSEIGRN